jgi:hypothetical protein
MTAASMNVDATIQGGNATTQQTPATATDRGFEQAVKEAMTANLKAQAAAARARSAAAQAAAAAGQPTAPTPPTPPSGPGSIVFRGNDGAAQTFTIPPIRFGDNDIPQQAVDISIAFFLTMAAIIIGLPLARAFARRMDRRNAPAQIPNEISSQLSQLNQAVDAIALEVERISEGQRYTTRLLSEQQAGKLPSRAER